MQIIIEYVLLDNFLIDAMLLYLTDKTLKIPISRLGLITASAFGAGFSVVSPLIRVSAIFLVLIKLSVALVMTYMMNFSHKKILLKFLVFVGYTFAFGGGLIAVFSFLGVSIYDGLNLGYISDLPLGTIIVSSVAFFVFAIRLIKSAVSERFMSQNSCEIIITLNNKSAKIKGFVDTGNTIKNSQGKSVIVINENTLGLWFSVDERLQLLLNKSLSLRNVESLTISSLGGNYEMKVFDCEAEIKGIKKEVAIGIAPSKIRCGDCLAIVGRDVVEV